MTGTILDVSGLEVSFDIGGEPAVAVDRLGFSLRAGESLGIVGESGSGKSTLLNMLSGRMEPTSGTIAYRDAAGRERDGAGVGVAEDELLFRAAANVQIHGADNTDIRLHACTSQMRSAYSRTARSAAKMPLRAMLTSDKRARSAGPVIVVYSRSCVAA